MNTPISQNPALPQELRDLFSLDNGPEYAYEYPPGYAEPIDGPLPIELEDYEDPEPPTYHIPSWDLIEDIQNIAKRTGRDSVAKHYYAKHGTYNQKTIRNRFGSWNNAIKLAGLEPRPSVWPEEYRGARSGLRGSESKHHE